MCKKSISPQYAKRILSTSIHQISTIFKTIEDETTISGQRIVGALQARKIAQQQATVQLETDIACIKKYEIACQSLYNYCFDQSENNILEMKLESATNKNVYLKV